MGGLALAEPPGQRRSTEGIGRGLVSYVSTFTVIDLAAHLLDSAVLADEEVDSIQSLSLSEQLLLKAQLVEAADLIREALRELDSRLLQLQGVYAGEG